MFSWLKKIFGSGGSSNMFSDTDELREELSSRFRAREVVLKWLFGEIKFTRGEFLAMYEVQDHVMEVLNKTFVEKDVMHIDLRAEDPNECIDSLNKIADYLDLKIRDLRGRLSKPQQSIIRLLEQIRSRSVEHAKQLFKRNQEIEKLNQGEYESEYRVEWQDWVLEPLREFRLAVYPLFRVLIDLLPPDHPAKQRVEDKWYEGRMLLLEKQKDNALPRWRLRES